MKLYTVWQDWYENGCGRSLTAIVTRAENGDAARKAYAARFGDFLAMGCVVEEGCARNAATSFLFSEAALVSCSRFAEAGAAHLYAEHHWNFS